MTTARVKTKILDAIDRLSLDLRGTTILTEAATGAYVVTPVIAALAGATVLAFTRETKYGSVKEVKDQTFELLSAFDQRDVSLEVIDELTPEIISKADVITNSGHLRPLNADKLRYAKNGLVIPLMYEAWEWREGDLDYEFCVKNSIGVGGTNERHPDVDVFSYLGDMALKLIFDAGLNPYKNKFILVCNNDFGPFIARTLVNICDSLGVCDKISNKNLYQNLGIDWLGDFPGLHIPEKYKNCEAIIFTAYPFDKAWIGANGEPFSIQTFKEGIRNPFILRYAGDIDEKVCHGQIDFYPPHVTKGHMGILPSAIGFDPIIRLQSGGLKSAQLMLNGEFSLKGKTLVEELAS